MAKETLFYREILADLIEHFGGKHNINAKEYAEYLGKTPEKICELIRNKKLPGIQIGREFTIPLKSIAVFEATIANVERR